MRSMTWVVAAGVLYLCAQACLAQDDQRPPRDDGNRWGDGNDHQRPPREGGQPGNPMPPNPPQPPQPPMGHFLSEEQMQQATKFLEDWDPYRLKQMQQMREQNPQEFMRNIQQAYVEMQRIQELQKTDPERYKSMKHERELDMHSFELGEKIRNSKDDEEKKKLTEELRGVLSELFDLREKHKDEEIQHLQDQLKRLQEEVDRRRKNKDRIVDSRLKDITGEGEDSHW